jgi:hypothetical protein
MADAETFKEDFLNSEPFKVVSERFSRRWENGIRRVSKRAAAYKNPTTGQKMTVNSWEGAVCGSVFNDLVGKRIPCTRGPLQFSNRLIPNAEDQTEDEYQTMDEDDDDSETEDRTRKKRKKSHHDPLFAEADHSHVELTRYAKLIAEVINQGWLPAILYKEKNFRAICHCMFSFEKPEDVNASFVRGLREVFLTTAPVQLKHHVCHKADRHPADTPFPPLENLLGFSLAQGKSWVAFHPPWIVPQFGPQPPRTFRTPRRSLDHARRP